ncbi:hypothetical protein RRG08_000922 [Elysia crispata]|uniref:Uncharacterized protein n=1 Tax=Elysia crispata TaxID=231223 RepID=A0AAE0Z4S1_9GAST|nr:hypothetical protein RRG08_000922 [Elysia crispata]
MEKKILSSYRYQELLLVGPTLPSQADRELPLTPLRVNRTIIGSRRGRGQYPGNSTIAVYRVTLFWDSTGSYSGPSPSCNIQSWCLTVCWVLCLFRVPWDLELNGECRQEKPRDNRMCPLPAGEGGEASKKTTDMFVTAPDCDKLFQAARLCLLPPMIDLDEYNRCLSLTQRWVQQYSGMIVLEGPTLLKNSLHLIVLHRKAINFPGSVLKNPASHDTGLTELCQTVPELYSDWHVWVLGTLGRFRLNGGVGSSKKFKTITGRGSSETGVTWELARGRGICYTRFRDFQRELVDWTSVSSVPGHNHSRHHKGLVSWAELGVDQGSVPATDDLKCSMWRPRSCAGTTKPEDRFNTQEKQSKT